MSPPFVEVAKHLLLLFGIMLALGTASAAIASKLRLPDVVAFLLMGTLLGPDMAGVIDIKADSALSQLLLLFGACYILFDGGAALRLKVLKEVWITILILATAGVLVTAAITALAAHYLLGLPPVIALLLASTIAATDPATLMPLFRQVKIKDRVAQTLMSESACNDATGAILTFAVLSMAMGQGQTPMTTLLFDLLKQATFGLLAGLCLGYLAALLIAHEKLGFLRDYAPLVSLMAVIGAFLSADGLQASGFMAVFAFGIVIGNKDAFGFAMDAGEQEKLDDFVETTALIMRMFIFILLGAQVNFSLIKQYLLGGVAVVTLFMLVARPLTVFLCAGADRRSRWSLKEMLFMSWSRETGVIPGALAGLLLGVGAPQAELIAAVTFIAILMTILIQATTTHWLAKKLGLLEAETS